MTRKDYVALSDTLARTRPHFLLPEARAQWAADCQAIAACIKATNKAFDADRFLSDCGTKP